MSAVSSLKFVAEPAPGGYCIGCGRSDAEAGAYRELGASALGELMYYCATCYSEYLRCAAGLVPMKQLVQANARLTEALQRVERFEHDLRDAGGRERDLVAQLERASAETQSLRVNMGILEMRLDEATRAPGARRAAELVDEAQSNAAAISVA